MLLKCPECELQVSDKAQSCPHCGYPMQPSVKRKPRNKNHKRRRLPNGFGQISEIKNRNLRNPFRAMVTVGKTPEGRPICKPLKPESYFPTYNDAYSALVEYNKNPYDLDSDISVKRLYERWIDEHAKKLTSEGSVKNITSVWPYCASVYDMRVSDLRARHIKGCMEKGSAIIKGEERQPTPNGKKRIKTLFNQMLDYAVEYELVDKNYARTFTLSTEVIKEIDDNRTSHMAFTDDEMAILWNHVEDEQYVDLILIQCYSGWRPNELITLMVKDVDIENWLFYGGSKTDAGKNRIVPIHSRIQDLIFKKYQEALRINSKYLFNYDVRGTMQNLAYYQYNNVFHKICNNLGLNPEHKPHDGRKHFVTAAKKYNVDEYAIKYIVGHNISDLTERVYTEREFSWLKSEIEKIK